MPPDPTAQQHWLTERLIDAMVRLSTATEHLTAEVAALRQHVAALSARGAP